MSGRRRALWPALVRRSGRKGSGMRGGLSRRTHGLEAGPRSRPGRWGRGRRATAGTDRLKGGTHARHGRLRAARSTGRNHRARRCLTARCALEPWAHGAWPMRHRRCCLLLLPRRRRGLPVRLGHRRLLVAGPTRGAEAGPVWLGDGVRRGSHRQRRQRGRQNAR